MLAGQIGARGRICTCTGDVLDLVPLHWATRANGMDPPAGAAPAGGSIPFARVAQCRGTRSRTSPVQVQILPRAPIWPASIKVMQRTFNPWNRAHYPGGPPIHCRVV